MPLLIISGIFYLTIVNRVYNRYMTEDNHESAKAPTKGIYLLPNLFTTASLFAGFYAIVAATQDRFEAAAIAIFIAMIMDGLDGRVARMTNTQSSFGEQYDSLADMASFGIAPAMIMYEWALISMRDLGPHWSKVGWLAAFIYIACAALRLARFNVQNGQIDKAYFMGLASPAAAAVMASFIWLCNDFEISGKSMVYVACALTAICGLLMVSNFTYSSFKNINIKQRVPFAALLLVVLIFVLITYQPSKVIFVGVFAYMLSGPIVYVVRRIKKHQRKPTEVDMLDREKKL